MRAYKRVLLVGKDIDNPIAKEQCSTDCIIIGDKEKGFYFEDLSVLQGRIDFTTRIDIYTHGSIIGGRHVLIINDHGIQTNSVLFQLRKLANSQPLYVHLWSCYGGATNTNVNAIPKDFILVTHTSESNISIAALNHHALIQSFSQKRESDSFADLAKHILVNSMHSSTININKDGKIVQLSFAANFCLKDLISDQRKVISEALESLKKQAAAENINLVFPNFLDDEINNFVKGYIIHLVGINSSELKTLLQNPHISKEDLKTLLNDNPFAYSALKAASFFGYKEIVELLINAGANLDLTKDDGATPLILATHNGHKDIVKLLINAGANLDLAKDDGATALFVAAQNGNKDIAELLINAGANLNLAKDDGATALILATHNGHKDIVKLLINAGANLNLAKDDGATALFVAAQNGNKDIAELLINAGANLNLTMYHGATPLFFAAQNGHQDIVELLIEAKADLNRCANNGATAIDIAAYNGHKDIVGIISTRMNYLSRTSFVHSDRSESAEVVIPLGTATSMLAKEEMQSAIPYRNVT